MTTIGIKTELDKLNSEVSGAIIEAETLLDRAVSAWRRVERAETQLAESLLVPEAERRIAERGRARAETTAAVLQALRGPS
jgi:hypothetical protein